MKELEEGTVLIHSEKSDSYSEELKAQIKLDITYTEVHKSTGSEAIALQFVRIYTDNEGGGNYFRIEVGYPPEKDEDETTMTFAFEDFEKIERILNDFKKRYEIVKTNFKK